MKALISSTASPLRGEIAVPGDKSISHRALIIGALAVGETRIRGLSEGEDVTRTAKALIAMGVSIAANADGRRSVQGLGIGGLKEPAEILDLGNSGTGARLMIGALASHPLTAFLTGDESLAERPMARIITPLERIGARFVARDGGRLPIAVIGAREALPIVYEMPVASAQVKSAILLAGLNAPGETTAIEPAPTRDHTERMLRHFGAEVRIEDRQDGCRAVTVVGEPELAARDLAVPGDPSAAAFPGVAALLVPESEVTVTGVGMNGLRCGLFETLLEMEADIGFTNRREEAGEDVADITFRASRLKGVVVPAGRAPAMIDEYPILAVAAAFADGETRMLGLAELRVKESDRLAAIARGLMACGADVSQEGDDLIVRGHGGPPQGEGLVTTNRDHRIAMAFLVMGTATQRPVRIDDGTFITTSFPGFADTMNALGAAIGNAGG